MNNIKQKILLTSLTLGTVATVIAIVATEGLTETTDLVSHMKHFTTAGYLGLLSVVSFFVGWVYPKDEIVIVPPYSGTVLSSTNGYSQNYSNDLVMAVNSPISGGRNE